MALAIRWELGGDWGGYNSTDEETHHALARWSADCAEHVLSYFETEHPDDDRPRRAIEATRGWTRGEVTVGEAVELSRATHAAAREANTEVARQAARAAGHAIATAHVDGHAMGGANYAITAVVADGGSGDAEFEWQREQLPEGLQSVVRGE
ncbi:putative immunity protein [Haloferax namakaokahaiae]|uniref:Immunity protein n=1 Tax=Haloferax namakaokahaiae TaxID=1748331 RepID=A0ABD5ZIK4_9EURY